MRLTILVFLAAATGACSGTMSGTDAIHSSVSEGIAEDQAYLGAARATTTMPDMRVVVDHHATRMDAILGDMTGDMGPMHQCSGMQTMMGLRGDMSVEMDSHVAAMHEMTNVSDARTEVEDHVARMHAMMDDMDRMLDGLHCP